MRLLIAQGPGFYGVNIRMINEATYERLLSKFEWTQQVGDGEFDSVHTMIDETMLVMTQDIEPHEKFSIGFDSGWWTEGEQAIEKALE